MEAVWKDERIACPNHIALWTTERQWYKRWGDLGLYFKHGKPLGPRKVKLPKCWTYICKNYGVVSRMAWGNAPSFQRNNTQEK